MNAQDKVDRLTEIKQEMLDLWHEAKNLMRGTGIEQERAKAYWLAQIRMALDNESSYLGRCIVTMQDAIDALDSLAESQPSEEDIERAKLFEIYEDDRLR
jgi:hypothetical protein